MSIPYRALFLLDHPTTSILEIKRLDLPNEQDPGVLYHWLLFNKAIRELTKLEFVSMQAQGDEQAREFGQGSLRFNPREGTYTPHGGPPLVLQVLSPSVASAELDAAIGQYLTSL